MYTFHGSAIGSFTVVFSVWLRKVPLRKSRPNILSSTRLLLLWPFKLLCGTNAIDSGSHRIFLMAGQTCHLYVEMKCCSTCRVLSMSCILPWRNIFSMTAIVAFLSLPIVITRIQFVSQQPMLVNSRSNVPSAGHNCFQFLSWRNCEVSVIPLRSISGYICRLWGGSRFKG